MYSDGNPAVSFERHRGMMMVVSVASWLLTSMLSQLIKVHLASEYFPSHFFSFENSMFKKVRKKGKKRERKSKAAHFIFFHDLFLKFSF